MRSVIHALRAMRLACLVIWGFLTAIVAYFVIDRLANPGMKSISDTDLKHYLNVSIYIIGAFLALQVMIFVARLIHRKKEIQSEAELNNTPGQE